MQTCKTCSLASRELLRWSFCGPFRRTCSNSSIAKVLWTSANNSKLARMGKYSKSLHMLHLTTPFNQSRSNSAQSLQVVAAHICVKTTAETASLHLYVVDLLEDLEPELTICQQRKSFPFVLSFSHVDPSSDSLNRR